MKRQVGMRLLETALLFVALFFTLSPIPSNEDPIDLMPDMAFAVVAFGASRALRWRGHWVIWGLEFVGFAAFAWAANMIANVLLTPIEM